MAESTPTDDPKATSERAASAGALEEGAPIPKDKLDPELIKLKHPRPKVGVITGAGVVFLCILFLVRLNGDRKFSSSETPTPVAVADVLAGKVDADTYISIDAEPMRSHAIRAGRSTTAVGFRVVPARGTGERLWLVLHGDGWEPPITTGYVGRLRALDDLPIAEAVRGHAAASPRPVFATSAATRAGFATGKVTTVAGDTVTLADRDQVAFDLVDTDSALIVAAINERFPTVQAWVTALSAAGITPGAPIGTVTPETSQVRFEVNLPGAVAAITSKLEAANLWAARVEPITRHYQTTWGALRGSSTAGFTVDATTIPDAQLDLVGLYVNRAIPDDAFVVITGERPQDYWHVLPITVALVLIGLLFAWALVRAVRRDVFPATPAS